MEYKDYAKRIISEGDWLIRGIRVGNSGGLTVSRVSKINEKGVYLTSGRRMICPENSFIIPEELVPEEYKAK